MIFDIYNRRNVYNTKRRVVIVSWINLGIVTKDVTYLLEMGLILYVAILF